jgi:hypothetical protein
LKDDADDVLADVVDVALHRGGDDLALGLRVDGAATALLLLDERDEDARRPAS